MRGSKPDTDFGHGAFCIFTYDLENRPLTITSKGRLTSFIYGPDGARVAKISNDTADITWFFGPDVSEDQTSGALTVHHAGMLKEVITATGSTLSLLVQDLQGSIRQTVTAEAPATRHDFTPSHHAPPLCGGRCVLRIYIC